MKGMDSSRPGSGGGAHQRGRGGKRRVDQAMAEGGKIGNWIAAVGDDDAVEVDELHQPAGQAAASAIAARCGQHAGSGGSGGEQHRIVFAGTGQRGGEALDGGVRRGRPALQARRRQDDGGDVMGGGLKQPGPVGDGVEEARRRHPARRLRIFGHHAGERRLFFRGRAPERRIEHVGIGLGQAAPGKQRIDIGQGPAVDRRSRHVMGARPAAIARSSGSRPVSARRWPSAAIPGGPPASEPGETYRAAETARHAASGAVVMKHRRAVPGTFANRDIGRIAGTGGAFVGSKAAGLNHQGPGDGGAPERFAGPGNDGPALAQGFLGEGFPDRVGEIAAEMGEADDGVLGAVHAARERRHQGDGNDDAHDRPGAEAETALAGGVHRPGHHMPDQQKAREQQHAGIEREQHGAQRRRAPRAWPADIAQEGENVAGCPVGIGEQARVDGLSGGGICRDQPSQDDPDKTDPGEAEAEPPAAGGRKGEDSGVSAMAAPAVLVSAIPHATASPSAGAARPHPAPRRRPGGPVPGEQEAQHAHGGQLAPAAGLARPGRRRMSSAASASPAASIAPRRSSRR